METRSNRLDYRVIWNLYVSVNTRTLVVFYVDFRHMWNSIIQVIHLFAHWYY